MDSISAKEWDDLSPKQRADFLVELNAQRKKAGLSEIGLSNYEKRSSRVTTKALLEVFEAGESKGKETDLEIKVLVMLRDMLGLDHTDLYPKSQSLVDDLGCDELDLVEVIMEIEKEFDLSISDDKVDRTRTVQDLIDLVVSEKGRSLETVHEKATDLPKEDELDLVFSFDDTGSMHTVRQVVRRNISALVNSLFSKIPKLRIGIIIHNDYCDIPNHIYTLDLTSNRDEINRFINRSSPQGGGDAPECYELALSEANKMSWKSSNRALIVIGDEVPHEVGYRHPKMPGPNTIDWRTEASLLSTAGVRVYGVQALGSTRSRNFYETISKTTDGVKLDLTQFQHVETYIMAIAHHQAGGLDEYQKSDPVFASNLSLRNMFDRLRGRSGSLSSGDFSTMSRFQVMNVDHVMKIKDFVEMNGLTYKRGRGFYKLIERTADGAANFEIVQADKQVIFVEKATGNVIEDTVWCRQQLGVPFGTKGTVRPLSIPHVMSKYDVFIQSNSFTRNLDPGVQFLFELDHR